MTSIKVRRELIKGSSVLIIKLPYDKDLIKIVKQLKGIRWNPDEKYWYTKDHPKKVQMIYTLFSGKVVIESDDQSLHQQFREHSQFNRLTKEDEEKIRLLKDWMTQKRYSQSTIDSYIHALSKFFSYVKPKSFENINEGDMIGYINNFIIPNDLSYTYQNHTITATKLFFRHICKTNFNVEVMERPRPRMTLPVVLSVEEVGKILKAHSNVKHRLMLSIIYACGLRRSELLNLRPCDIDSKRETLFIRQSKGNKDRYVNLPHELIDELREYYKREKPKTYLFEGQKRGMMYSPTSLAEVLKKAIKKAGIKKHFTLHGLRHCYATHLLESGTGLRHLQELLGHKSSKTTERYTHVTNDSLKKIRSPYKDLDL